MGTLAIAFFLERLETLLLPTAQGRALGFCLLGRKCGAGDVFPHASKCPTSELRIILATSGLLQNTLSSHDGRSTSSSGGLQV